MSMRTTAIASLTTAACIGPAAAQDTVPEVVGEYISASAIEKTPPRYPASAAREGREGWVVVSYVVAKDGELIERMIEDSSGSEDFERAAIDVLDNWIYEPARLNDEPVEQSMTRTRIVFKLDSRPGQLSGASRGFVRRYQEILDVINEGDFERADGMITDLRYTERQNLYEDAWFWWLRYQYLEATDGENELAMRDSLHRALGYEEDYLVPDVFVAAAERLFILQVRALDFSAAINTFERLRNSRSAQRSDYFEPTLEGLEANVESIRKAIEGPSILRTTAQIGEHGYWVHDLLRRSFSIGEIDGKVEAVDLRCRRGTIRYQTISEGNTWSVPEAWGQCGAYIKGAEGTTFGFYELPEP